MLHWTEGKAFEPGVARPVSDTEVPEGEAALPAAFPGVEVSATLRGQGSSFFSNYAMLAAILLTGMFLGWLGTVIGSSMLGHKAEQVAQGDLMDHRQAGEMDHRQAGKPDLQAAVDPRST